MGGKPRARNLFPRLLKELDACDPARAWIGRKGFRGALRKCERGDWMLWLFLRLNHNPKQKASFFNRLNKKLRRRAGDYYIYSVGDLCVWAGLECVNPVEASLSDENRARLKKAADAIREAIDPDMLDSLQNKVTAKENRYWLAERRR